MQPDRAPSGGHKCCTRLVCEQGKQEVPSFEDSCARPRAVRGQLCPSPGGQGTAVPIPRRSEDNCAHPQVVGTAVLLVSLGHRPLLLGVRASTVLR